MSKTLLLLKLLQGEDVRSCSLLSRQHVYATLQLNHEVEVRSTTAMRAGPRPEFNQLFMLELGPWWKGKDVVLQLFSKNRLRKDSFLGGCSCKLGELVRAVGLDDSHNEGGSGSGGGGGGSGGGGGAYGGGASLAELGSAGVGSFATSSASPSPSASPLTPGGGSGAFDASLAPTPGLVSFQRVSAEEVRRFGELLPVLPGTSGGADDDAHGAEGADQTQQPGAMRGGIEGEDDAAASAAAADSASTAGSSAVTGSSARRLRARSVAPAALPCTWLILRHGGGPAALRQFPPPQWHLPAGRLAIYLDFIVLPPSSIPKMMSAPGQRSGVMSGSATPLLGGSSAAAAAAAERERRQLVCLPSTILPNGWLGMSDNEKLAWAHAHRRARAAPVPQPMGGLVAFVARGLLGAGGGAGGSGSSSLSGSASPLSGGPLGAGAGAGAGSGAAALSSWPFPWSQLQSAYATLLSSNVQDRVFYSWYAVLGLAVLMTEIMFTRPQHAHGFAADPLPFWEDGAVDASAAAAASTPTAAVESDEDWFSLPSGALLWSLTMGVAILKFGWNMLNDHQISHPWRRLDLVLTLLLGLGLGAAAQIAAAGTAATRVLGMLALAVTHAYARAALYQSEVVAGVVEEQFRPVVACGGGREARLRHVEPLDQKAAVLRWTAASLADTYTIGRAWVTGKAARAALVAGGPAAAAGAAGHRAAIPGSIQLCLRSCFFLVGQVCAQWVLLPAPSLLRWWLSALTWAQVAGFVLPLFLFLLLFMFGKESAALRGRPWLMLFGLNSLLLLYASLRFLPVLAGLVATALLHTLWSHKWSLLSLPLEWALAAAFVPNHVWHAAHLQARVDHAMLLPAQHAHVQSHINPLHINMNYMNAFDMQQQHQLQQPGAQRMQYQQEGRPEGRRSGSATPAAF